MGAVVVGFAGQAIGSAFGGPIGGAIGGLIGSAIGGALFSGSQNQSATAQPLIELKIVGTDYGQAIPWGRGAFPVAGQMWWNSDRRPIYTTTSSGGGKGGASTPASESTTVSYEMDCLIGLVDQVIVGVRNISENGKLIWTNSTLASGASIGASGATEHWRRMTVYTGADDQLPDPTYEAAVGVGNAPAYIGRGTVFIEGLQLGSGGAVRNLTFDVVIDGGPGGVISYVFEGSSEDTPGRENAFFDGTRYVWRTDTGTDTILIFDPLTREWQEPIVFIGGRELAAVTGLFMTAAPTWNVVFVNTTDGAFDHHCLVYRLDTREFVIDLAEIIGDPGYAIPGYVIGVDETNDRVLMMLGGEIYQRWAWHDVVDGLPLGAPSSIVSAPFIGAPTSHYDELWGRGIADAAGDFWFISLYADGLRRVQSDGTDLVAAGADGINNQNPTAFAYDTARDCIYFWSADMRYLKKMDCSTQTITRVNSTAYSTSQVNDYYMGGVGGDSHFASIRYAADIDRILLLHGGQTFSLHLHVVNPVTGLSETIINIPASSKLFYFAGEIAYSGNAVWAYASKTSGALPGGIGEIRLGLGVSCPTVADVQASICERSGLDASQYDVSALDAITRTVCCLPWAQITPGRRPTEEMMSAYYYEITVSDKLYFRPRGGAPVATIAYDEFGAVEGSGEPSEPLALHQANDIELPAKIALTYANLSNDYQTDTQPSDRLISAVPETVRPVTMQMGFVPEEAKAIVNTMLLDQVLALVSTQVSVLGHLAGIEPTDVFVATGKNGETYRLRAIKKRDAFPLIAFDAVLDDASILSDVGITGLDYESSTTVNPPVDTTLRLLDIPILRDADDNVGFYAATKGNSTPYVGSAVYKSATGVDFERAVTIAESAVIGVTTTALGDWLGPRAFDEMNSVIVSIGRGTLSSSTRDELLNRQVNAMLIGHEIIQFRTATLQSSGIYKLTGLLRGCRGTEWAMTGHVSGERVVSLRREGLRRIVLTNAEIGIAAYYRGVTLGRALSSAPTVSFTSDAIGLKPFSPFDLRATRDGSNNITFTWQRRSRLSVRTIGPLGINVPLGEDAESYKVRIYNPASDDDVLRTITVSTPTATYSAANQTSDGLTPGDEVHAGVVMVSATVGDGYEFRGIV